MLALHYCCGRHLPKQGPLQARQEERAGVLPHSLRRTSGSGLLRESALLSVTTAEFRFWLRRRERKNLAMALKDTRSVVGTLTYALGAILQAVFFLFYLLILRVHPNLKP